MMKSRFAGKKYPSRAGTSLETGRKVLSRLVDVWTSLICDYIGMARVALALLKMSET